MCQLLGGQHSFGGGCQHKPGEDRVTADPSTSILGRNIKGKAIHSRLGRAIGGAEAVSEQGFTRTGVDDRSGLGFQHRGKTCFVINIVPRVLMRKARSQMAASISKMTWSAAICPPLVSDALLWRMCKPPNRFNDR